MANAEHLSVIHNGAEAYEKWRLENPEELFDLSNADLTGFDLDDFIFKNVKLFETNFASAKLRNTDFSEATLFKTTFNHADLSYANFKSRHLIGCQFQNADLSFSNMSAVKFHKCNLSKIKIKGAKLAEANFHYNDFTGMDFSEFNLTETLFNLCTLNQTNFSEANLTKSTFMNCELNNVQFFKSNLYRTTFRFCDISGGNFAHAKLYDVRFIGSPLRHTRFDNARIIESAFENINLFKANFSFATIELANFSLAFIQGSDFRHSILEKVNFIEADLTFADFSESQLLEIYGANFENSIISINEDDLEKFKEPKPLESMDGLIMYCNRSPEKFNYAVLEIFFGTDRKFTGNSKNSSEIFGSNRGELTIGKCEVSIPRVHALGKLEGPSIWKLEFRNSADRHVVLQTVLAMNNFEFLNEFNKKIAFRNKKQAFVFIHGYNVSFEDAARRTAQLHYDLGFDGVPVFYSWPSESKALNYTVDETNIDFTEPHLEAFLKMVLERTEVDLVHLVAHSMGNRALLRVLKSFAQSIGHDKKKITNVVFTAPDVDREHFINLIPFVKSVVKNLTLYASSNDKALILSKTIHKYPRAGDAGQDIVVIEDLDTIDVSKLDSDFVGHSYFGDHKSVISDLFNLLNFQTVPEQRFGLRSKNGTSGNYWEFTTGM